MTTLVQKSGRPHESLAAKRVMVVDDNPLVGAVTAEALSILGYHALHCTTGDEALRLCRRGGIDAVLLEVGLTTSDGSRLASALSARHPELPVAVLTAWLDHPETDYLDRHGLRMVLQKPFRFDQLDLAVRALLDDFRAR